MRRILLIAFAVLTSVFAHAAPGGASLDTLLLEKNGELTGSDWKQLPAISKYSYVAGYLGAVFSVSDWMETIASERSSAEIERVAVQTLGLTKGPDVSVKWLAGQLDAFYTSARNERVAVFDAALTILKQNASK
jgi:hypothetical protein